MNLSCRRLFINGLLIGSAYYAGALVGFALTFSDDAVSTLAWRPNWTSDLLAANALGLAKDGNARLNGEAA